MNTALLIVDIQNDYFPGGKMELAGSPEAARRAAGLLAFFRQAGLPVVFIQHIANRPGATFFLPGTPGAEIHPEVQPLHSETILQKHFPNSFRDTPLLEHLRSLPVERLVICGMMTHMCVDAATRAAVDFGFECWVAGDACATRDLAFAGQTVPVAQVHAAFLAALNSAYGKVLSAAEIIAQLQAS
ncbi:MAG: cysteine hydrolase family protein [Chloroflexota bacterium]